MEITPVRDNIEVLFLTNVLLILQFKGENKVFSWHSFFEARRNRLVDNLEESLGNDDRNLYLSIQRIDEPIKLCNLLNSRGYYIAGLFELGNIYTNLVTDVFLLWLSKIQPENIYFSIFNGLTYDLNKIVVGNKNFEIPERYNNKYEKYMDDIESVINNGQLPSINNPNNNISKINYADLNTGRLYPRYYTKQAYKIRESLKNQAVFKLKEVATVIVPDVIQTEYSFPCTKTYKVIGLDSLKYPFDTSTLIDSVGKLTCVQKKDILFPVRGMNPLPYYFNFETDEEISCNTSIVIIRCNQVSPEFLYVYLMSETGKTVIDSFVPGGERFKGLTPEDIENIPVVIPEYDDDYYEYACDLLLSSDVRDYKLMSACAGMDHYWKLKEDLKTEAILDTEIAQKIKMHNEQQLNGLLVRDLEELNICFHNKAYKATLILAGSILEAVLIDWLSEIHGKNYFTEEFYVIKNGKRQRADLIDYINEIKYIKRPRWMDEADKAHKIRQKRNLVHAKLCINSDEINESVCREVISYLSDVLMTRGVNISSGLKTTNISPIKGDTGLVS